MKRINLLNLESLNFQEKINKLASDGASLVSENSDLPMICVIEGLRSSQVKVINTVQDLTKVKKDYLGCPTIFMSYAV